MKKREFNKVCKTLCGKDGLFDKEKINQLDNASKNSLISFLVRNRESILANLLNKDTNTEWLTSILKHKHK